MLKKERGGTEQTTELKEIEDLLKPFSDILEHRPALKKILIEFGRESPQHFEHLKHSVEVARLCGKVGDGFYEAKNSDVQDLITAGLFHDVGKKFIAADFLDNKNGQLTDEQQRGIKLHPASSLELLNGEDIPASERLNSQVLSLIGSHHEVWKDGGSKGAAPLEQPYPRAERTIISAVEDKRFKKIKKETDELIRVFAMIDRMQATTRGHKDVSNVEEQLRSFMEKDTIIDTDTRKKLGEILDFIKKAIKEKA